jgi:hypothetical protein
LSQVLQNELFLPRLPDEVSKDTLHQRETVRRWLEKVGTEVTVSDLVGRFFAAHTGRPLTAEECNVVTAVTHWACKSNRRDVIRLVLTETNGSPRLVQSDQVYLGGRYGQPEIEAAGRSSVAYVSERYLDTGGSQDEKIDLGQWATFFRGLTPPVRYDLILEWAVVKTLSSANSEAWDWFGVSPP